MNNLVSKPIFLIAEDDPQQLELLVQLVATEISMLISVNRQRKVVLNRIKIIQATNTSELETVLDGRYDIVMALIDCNMPEKKGGNPSDLFLKTNHLITGQHKAVDLILDHSVDSPITMISSMDRFRRLIPNYYRESLGIEINFINKREMSAVQRNVSYWLRHYTEQELMLSHCA